MSNRCVQTGRKIMTYLNTVQMELTLGTRRAGSRHGLRPNRRRAHLWFERMRQIVDRAPEWPMNDETQAQVATTGAGK